MDEQYTNEDRNKEMENLGISEKKQHHHLTLVVALAIILIMAIVYVFVVQYKNTPRGEMSVIDGGGQDLVYPDENYPLVDVGEETGSTPAAEIDEVTPQEQTTLSPDTVVNTEGFSEIPRDENGLPLVPSMPALPIANTPGLVSCFDYYKFGSVQVSVAPYFNGEVTPDSAVIFGGDIVNQNPYPVVDGQIYMKVFKIQDDGFEKFMEDGYPLIDFVLIQDKVHLPANGTKTTEFEWQAPAGLAEGEYMAAFFFTTSYRYNLLGLSFTDDVTGNTSTFTVNREDSYQPVAFDKHSVYLNNQKHRFALPPWSFGKDEQVVAYATLVNDSDELRTVDVVWEAYKWDGILASNKKETESYRVDVPANGEVEIAYQTPTLDTAVTFVQVTANEGSATSTLQIRYVRDYIEETRINYPSLFTYPLRAGQEATVFSCMHSTNMPLVSDSTLALTISDKAGNVVHSYTYEGDITGAMMGVKDSFIPKRDLVNLSLNAKLTKGGEVVEEVTIEYNCADIDPSLCSLEESQSTDGEGGRNLMFTLALVLVFILLLTGGYWYVRRNN